MAATEGYATSQTLRVFSHARDLLGEGGTPTEQMTVSGVSIRSFHAGGEYRRARSRKPVHGMAEGMSTPGCWR